MQKKKGERNEEIKSREEIERSVSSVASSDHAGRIFYKRHVMFNEMCTCSRTLLSRLSRIPERGARGAQRSRYIEGYEVLRLLSREKTRSVRGINCGRDREGCPRASCAIIGDCIGTVAEKGDQVRACFNLPPRVTLPSRSSFHSAPRASPGRFA